MNLIARLLLAVCLLALPVAAQESSDALPEGVRLRLGTDRFRDPNYINATGLSPDGKVMAWCAGTPSLRLIETATGKQIQRIHLREYIRNNQIFFTDDGKQVVTVGYNSINFWSIEDGKLARTIANLNRDGRDGNIQIAGDGKSIAIGCQVENGTVRVIDSTTGDVTCTVKPIQNSTLQGVLSANGAVLATWGNHYNRGNPGDTDAPIRAVQLWNVKEAKELATLQTDCSALMSVRFSKTGDKIVTAGNGIIQLWDVASGKMERRFAGRSGQGMQLAFSPDGRFVSSVGQDGCVQSWEIANGKRAGICEGPGASQSPNLQYRPDGQLVAWAVFTNSVEMWEAPSGKRLTPSGGHRAPIASMQFAADGKQLLSSSSDGRLIRWDLSSGKELDPFEGKRNEAKLRMYGYTLSNNGPTIFSPNGKYMIGSSLNGGAGVWDVAAGIELFGLATTSGYVDRSGVIAFSPDSNRIIAMNRYYNREQGAPIPVWDVETGAPLPPLKGQKGDLTCAGFSSDGSILVTCSYAYQPQGGQLAEAWAWDLSTGKCISKVQIPNTQITLIQFLDERQFVVFSPNNQPIKVFDAMKGTELRTLESSITSYGAGLCLSPDGRLLAFGTQGNERYAPDGKPMGADRRILVWEVASGTLRHELKGIEGQVTAIAFSRDGKTLAHGSSDTTITLWDLQRKPEKLENLSPADLADAWKELEAANAKRGEAAMQKLAALPNQSLPFLLEKLRPSQVVKSDNERIAKLITNLDAPRFAVREAASRELERIGNLANSAIRAELAKDISPEVRERLEKLADRSSRPIQNEGWLRPIRGVELLERIGTPGAIAHLKELANGGDSPLTRAAKSTLSRLAHSPN